MKSVCRALLLVAALFAVPALAQSNYVVTSVTQPYVALTGTGVTSIPSSSWTSTGTGFPDDAIVTIPLGFSFPYFGNIYTDVTLSTNGWIGFGSSIPNDCPSGCLTSGGTIPTTTRTPHNVIAPWWRDLKANSSGGVRYSNPNPSELVIEYYDWNEYSGSASFNFEIRLNSSGLIQVHYGPESGSLSGAVVGFEDSTGAQGGPLWACGATGSCGTSNWVADTLFTIGQPVQPDLMVQSVNLNSTSRNGTSLSVSVSPTFRNIGQNDATNFHWKAYLSTDTTLDASDPVIYDSSAANAPVTVLGANNTTNPTATATGSGTLSNVSNANYYVLVEADITNVVAEFSENNNLGATLSPFTFGVDLVADSISGPAQSGPGNSVTWNLGWHNAGTDQPLNNPQTYQIVISLDQTLSANDMVAATWTEPVAGGQSCSGSTCAVTLPIGTNLPGGDFYWGLVIDPGNTSGDVDPTNNAVFSSAKVHLEQADLEMQSMDFLDNNTLQPTRVGYFGGTGTAKVTLKNIGGADARNFDLGVMISTDSYPTLSADNLIHSEPVALLAAGDTQTYTVTFDIPTVNAKGVTYTSGSYFVFVYADIGGQVTELSELNNARTTADSRGSDEPVNLRTPAPDYAVLKVDAPSTAAVGELVPVYRVLRNVGNDDGVEVSYRYFASVNDDVSDEDQALPIVGANGQSVDNGLVTLGTGETDSQTEFVRLPPTMAAGTWYIGVVVDVTKTMAELDESNNAGSTSSVVQVAPSAMRITNQQLPDATTNVPYAFRLSTTGATGPVSWTTEDPLPAGLSLSKTDGVISGIPKETSITAFTVLAEAGAQSTASLLVMRVLPTTGELAVATQNLPPVVSDPNVPYVADLAAAGGTRPYTWTLLSGVLPNGIRMDTAGHFTGAAKPGVPVGETQLVVQVVDANGNSAQAQLKLKVVEPGALVISSLALPDTMVNADYIADLAAKNADGTTISGSLSWSIISGRLPEGISLTVQANVVGLLTGKAIESGTFPLTLQVVDEKGRSDVADFILRVFPARLKLSAVNAPTVVHPGDKVSFQITTGAEGCRYRFYSGSLAPGLSIDENGTVAGTVELENSVGTWNYVVEADSATSGQSLGAFSMEVTPAPVKTGCSSVPGEGGGFGLLALLAPLAALLARRRRGAAAAVVAVAAVALVGAPGSASAQTTNYYTVNGPYTATPYQALSGGQLLTVDPYNTGATVAIPFEFEFYGKKTTSLGVSLHGYVSISNSLNDYHYSTGIGIPYTSTSYPPNIIAPWWGELNKTGGTTVKAGTIGAAPNREFVVEWNNVCNSYSCTSTGKFSMQVHLYEGSNRIRFAYGTGNASSNSAVGIQGAPGVGIAGLTCTNSTSGNCSNSSFPAGKVIDFALPPDLQISGLSVDNIGYVGVPQSAVASVINKGGLDAQGSVVRFYLSTDAFFDEAEDTELGDSSPGQTVKVLETVAHTASLIIPSSVEAGDYYLFAKVDPTNAVNEGDKEGNNVTPPMPFTVGGETPNLSLASISGPGMMQAGGMVALTGTVINSGNADTVAPAKVSYFVSDNSVVSVSDVLLGTGDVPVVTAPNGTQELSESFALPSDLPAGKYWVGACVDYDASATPKSAITEISEVDNCLTGNSFILNTGAVAVVTSSLQGATQNGPYGLRLEAIGGDGNYTWSLAGGALPKGMTLSPAGDLVGTPSEAGTFNFTVKVSSAEEDATKDLTLEVAAFNEPLSIVDQDLPGAEFGRGYATQLVAKGGHPPYQWSLQQGTKLPEGLGLSSDGFVEGRAAQARDTPYMFTVSVKDADGTEAARDLSIRVVLPSSMHIATSRLKTAYIGSNYSQDLQAIGGAGQGYIWSVIRFERLAQDPTDVPGAVEANLPDGFGLAIQQGNANTPARLTGKPNQAGLYAVTLLVTDAAFQDQKDTTTLPLLVSYDKPLAITTTVLPDAFVGSNYNVKVSHNQGAEAGVTFSNPCIQQASSTADGFTYNCVAADASQQLPAGLSLGSDGAITGIPTALPGTPAEANSNVTVDPVVYSFLVKATDSQGRSDVRSLSIKVRPAPVAKTGCSGTGLEPAALALLAFAGSLLRRRRK